MNETLLVIFQVLQGIRGINPQVFPALTWERGHFFLFSTFQTLDYSITKTVQSNPCGFIRHSKKGPINKFAKFR